MTLLDDWSIMVGIKRKGIEQMTPRVSTKPETKEALLEAGIEIMFEKGYTNTGISEVLKKVNVPKGSFYYYFDSKEDFALEIINTVDTFYTAQVLSVLKDDSIPASKRLKNYCKAGKEMILESECKKGCIIGNLSQEMSCQSETLRQRLYEVITNWSKLFSECIKEGQDKGEINKDFSSDELAEFFLSGWQGAILRSKTTLDTKPLDTFMELTFDGLLKP